jgi:hypothetical protein
VARREGLRRGHRLAHAEPTELVPGVGDTRFARLHAGNGDVVEHVYVALTSFAALLESALHDAAPPVPRVTRVTLVTWAESRVRLATDVRLNDLRDAELARVGIERHQLVATSAAHYPCTRRWASHLLGQTIDGELAHGLLWHSRPIELHGRALDHRPALRDLVDHHPAEVAVLWSPPSPAPLLAETEGGLGPLADGEGRAYVANLTAELAIVTT